MTRRLLAAALLAGLSFPATAGIVFTPHLSEYARQPRGHYTEFTLTHTRIEDSYDREGHRRPVGAPFVPPGERIDATLVTFKSLWVGNLFRDSRVPLLATRPQFCRLIVSASHQQATGAITERSRLFGLRSGGSGLGDAFGLCGIYGEEHRLGPLQFNGMLAATVKAPVGRWDEQALLNAGTDYWSVAPQLALHANLAGRLFVDATVAYQFKGHSDRPAYGGLTPTRPADMRNAEINVAWKLGPRWYVDAGFSYRETVGSNVFGGFSTRFVDPVPPEQACTLLNLADALCNSANLFFLEPQDRAYRDQGIRAQLVTAGVYYVYRSSSVLGLRLAQPVGGKGSQIDVSYDVHMGLPDLARPGRFIPGPRLSETTTTLNGVQESAAVSASPYLELRFVHLFWAP